MTILQRRKFIALLGGAAASPLLAPHVARAQRKMPAIGYLHIASAAPFARFLAAFKSGLKEGGYVEGENVAIEYRWAEGQADRLPTMAAELVRRGVTVIATGGGEFPALAAKAATKTIPVVFVIGNDPVNLGLVPSLARPAGNVTGISMLTALLESKRFGLLREMIPGANTIAAMVDSSRNVTQTQVEEVRAAAAQLGVKLAIVEASKESDIAPAFAMATAQGAGALQICASPFFLSRRQQLVAVAAHHRLPTMYEGRDYAEAGGLMSYGTDLADAYRQSGAYVARVLKGTPPSDLPVMQAARFEFVINLVTAKALGLEIAPMLLARADSVIE
jgi:putative tryptophan/tyrosine transport system substrate-binding protein